jgi:RNA polymerase sigma-70 factor (ECF subfamily)
VTEQELIERCKKNDRLAQQALYDRYSPHMWGVCLRYMKNPEDAEDVLVEGFYKIFDKLDSYRGDGSFEGWIRRVLVNEALMALRKKNNFAMTVELEVNMDVAQESTIDDELSGQEILLLLDLLPTGYRTVFNLYVLEGFKHREIAEILGISINTSKSQLILAKQRLKEILLERNYPDVG